MVDIRWVVFGLSCVLFLCFTGLAVWSILVTNRLGVGRAHLSENDFGILTETGQVAFLDRKAVSFLLKLPQVLRFISYLGIIGAVLSACGAAIQVASLLA